LRLPAYSKRTHISRMDPHIVVNGHCRRGYQAALPRIYRPGQRFWSHNRGPPGWHRSGRLFCLPWHALCVCWPISLLPLPASDDEGKVSCLAHHGWRLCCRHPCTAR
ncbi:hypothetical protein GGI23_006655, partial [Coemansia sp. RSA 2559]